MRHFNFAVTLGCATLCALLLPNQVSAQTTFTAVAGADQPYTVPAGISNLFVQLWGAGGGGANATTSGAFMSGGGGAYLAGNLTVTPGQILYITPGQGGQFD